MAQANHEDNMAHQNRRYGIPRNGGKHMLLSRTPPLTGGMKTRYGHRQSLGPWSAGDPTTWPKDWPKAGKVLGVPKCVILSSLPMWTAWWPACYMYAPSDISGQMFTSPFLFGNYYYFDQWNLNENPIIDSTRFDDRDARANAQFWETGYVFDDMAGAGNKDVYSDEYMKEFLGLPDLDPAFSINDTSEPPETRFNELVLRRLQNPYYLEHQRLRQNFAIVADRLASDPVDPIYVIDAAWLPYNLYQIRNAYLTKTYQKFNDAHGNGANIVDVIPCYTQIEGPWGPYYPNPNDPRNSIDFDSNTVPWLTCDDPGFGTNVLHMYIGHACHNYIGSRSIFDMQAWPISPEGTYLGPTFLSNYTGAGLPAFKGRRAVWRDAGLDNGFTGPNGAVGVYSNYAALVTAAAEQYRQNSQKYRNFKTKWYTYRPNQWAFPWQLNRIFLDQRHDCGATQFYFGFSFEDFANQFSNEDNWYEDLSGYYGGLKVAANYGNVPNTAKLQEAVNVFYPPIRTRVESYYQGLEPGTAQYFQHVLAQNDLPDCEYMGDNSDLSSVEGIIETIREHFGQNP